MNYTISILQQLLNDTDSEVLIVFDSNGNPIESLNASNQDSISAMGEAILSMCDKFLDDLNEGLLKQIYVTTTKGHVLFAKINPSRNLVIFNNAKLNTGLFFHNVEEACLKLNDELNSN